MSNLENIEELVADGTVVASEMFNVENEQEPRGRHNVTSMEEYNDESHLKELDKDHVNFNPRDSLILQLKYDQSVMSRWNTGARRRGDTILRCNPGRRSDLGSVGPKCLSWSGPQSENEANIGQSLAHLVGRKGGMV